MKVEIIEVTPSVAKEWLKRNVNFRTVRQPIVKKLAGEMPHWDVNGESIKFDARGNLIDGQHRLLACIEANAPFTTVVFWGAERDVNIDGGLKRTFIDILKHKGESYQSVLASGLNLLYRYERTLTGDLSHPYSQAKTGISNDILIDCLHRHPQMRASCPKAYQVRDWLPASTACVLHYIASTASAEYADGFFESLAKGTSLTEDDPVFLLRTRLEKERGAKTRLLPVEKTAIVTIAWNFTVQNRPMKRLGWNAVGPRREPYPLISDERGEPIKLRADALKVVA